MSSDKFILHGYLCDHSGQWCSATVEEIKNATHEFAWIHIDSSYHESVEWIANFADLNEITSESLFDHGTRPRCSLMKEGLLLILRGVNCNPGNEPEDMVAIRMLFSERIIFTLRNRKIMAMQDMKERIDKGQGPETKGEFLCLTTESIANRMADTIEDLEEIIDEIEDSIDDDNPSELASKISDVRRMSIRLRRYIAPQRDVLYRLIGEKVKWLQERDKTQLKEIAERTSRFVEDIDSARDRATVTLEELNSRISNRMNKAVYILSIITAIFLPLGLLTGLLGINVGGIPGSEYKWAFFLVTAFIFIIALGLLLWFKRIRWL